MGLLRPVRSHITFGQSILSCAWLHLLMQLLYHRTLASKMIPSVTCSTIMAMYSLGQLDYYPALVVRSRRSWARLYGTEHH